VPAVLALPPDVTAVPHCTPMAVGTLALVVK
jgi:hypothetical protein